MTRTPAPRVPPPVPSTPTVVSGGLVPTADPVLGFMTDDQLRVVYGRLEELADHQLACCAAQRAPDGCRYDVDLRKLYDVLVLAGVPDSLVPLSRDTFESWLATRPTRRTPEEVPRR